MVCYSMYKEPAHSSGRGLRGGVQNIADGYFDIDCLKRTIIKLFKKEKQEKRRKARKRNNK